MKDYRKRIILENRGELFLPGGVLKDSTLEEWGEEWIINKEGYLSLSHWMELHNPRLPEQLDLLDRILHKLSLCQEYLMDPCTMMVDRSSLWISAIDGKDVRISYQPADRQERNERMVFLIQEFMLLNRDPVAADHLQLIMDRIRNENPSLSKIQRMVLQIRRELTICGWIEKNRAT